MDERAATAYAAEVASARAARKRVWVLLGNTGRARVNAFRRMPVPDDLRSIVGSGEGEDPWRTC